jgi:hypothetical protein
MPSGYHGRASAVDEARPAGLRCLVVKRSAGFFAALAFFVTLEARAEEGPAKAEDPVFRAVHPERRNGLVFGFSGGGALAGASGYPSTPKLMNNPNYYMSSPLLGGWSTNYFLMGALTDYLSFGPNVTIATFESDKWKSTGFAVGFRGEVFPLLTLVPALADLSVYAQLGIGSTELRPKGPYPTGGGTQSFFGMGVHHEWRLTRMLGGHAAAGPYVEYDAIRTTAFERHWASAGLRVAFYAGSVKLDH